MNPDAPRTAQEELEIRITALLMGELPPDEAAALLAQITADPELTALHARLRHAVDLLREARTLPEQPAPATPMKLSKERREQLLAKFRGLKVLPPDLLSGADKPKNIPLQQTLLPSIARQKKKRDWKWGGPVGLAAAITIFGGGLLLTTAMRPYSAHQTTKGFAEGNVDFAEMEDPAAPTPRGFVFAAPNNPKPVSGPAPAPEAAPLATLSSRASSRYGVNIDEAESKRKVADNSLARLSDEALALAPQRPSIANASVSSLYLPKGQKEDVANWERKPADASTSLFSDVLLGGVATASGPSQSQRGASPRSEDEKPGAAYAIDALSTNAPTPVKAETNWAFKQLADQPADAGIVASVAPSQPMPAEVKADASKLAVTESARDAQPGAIRPLVSEGDGKRYRLYAGVTDPGSQPQPTPSKPASAGVNADDPTPASAATGWASQPGAIRSFASQADGTRYRLTAESKDANPLSQLSPSLPAPAAAKADAPEPMAAADFAIAPQPTLSLATVAAKKAPMPVALAAAPVDAKPTSGPSARFDVDGEKPVNAEYFSKSLAGVPLSKEKAVQLGDVAAANAPVAPIVIDPSADALKTDISGLATGRGLERAKLAVAGDGLPERERRQEVGRYDLQEKVVEKPAGGDRDNKAADFDDVRSKAMWEVSSAWQRPYRRFDKRQVPVERRKDALADADKRADFGSERMEDRAKSDSQPTSADRATAMLGFITDEQAEQVQIDGRTDSFFGKAAPDANYWDQKVIKGKDDAKQWFEQAPTSHFTYDGTRGSSPATNPADKTVGEIAHSYTGAGTININGGAQGVDLDLAPQVVEFEGFINYGSPIPTTSIDANGREVKNVITSSFIGKPGLATGKFGEAARGGNAGAGAALREEDAFAALGDLAFSLPVVGNPAAAKLADDLFTMPVVAEPYGLSAPLSTGGKVAVDRPLVPFNYNASSKVDLAKKIEPPAEPPAPPQKAEAPIPQPEISVKENAFSTFSLNVSDVSFKLAESALGQNAMPNVESVRVEEFINALDYRDPAPAPGAPLAFASERARYPFAQNRDLLRLSVKTAEEGRQAGRPLNITLLLDNSGSMERADRVRILQEALAVLAKQLQPQDKLSIITFSRIPRLWADGVAGDKAVEFTGRVAEIRPEGGTDLGTAMDLGYTTALKHYQVGSVNRVVLLTDGAANLGNVDAAALKAKVESHRKQGVAFDCFGVGWEGYNDDLLEQLSRNGDGRYGFINTPEAAATEFAGALAGALRVAASDVKVQVEFNPRRVTSYRQIGYAKHQLKKEQFRDNTVDAAEIGAAEAGNALYTVEIDPAGVGDIGVVRVRFKVPGTTDYKEHEWAVPFNAPAPALGQSSSSLRLAATAGAFGEFLAQTQFATDVTTDKLLGLINGIPAIYGADPRPGKLEWMIRQAKSISGR